MAKKKGKNVDNKKSENVSSGAKKTIVIEEKEEDILVTELKGDPENFKQEVKKEAQKGSVARILIPIFFFLLLGSVVGAATWYYQRAGKQEEVGRAEDKIQTPPVISEEEPKDTPAEPTPAAPTTPATGYIEYTVKAGDTLSGIANAHNLTSTDLARYNNITNLESLQIGQVLRVPRGQ